MRPALRLLLLAGMLPALFVGASAYQSSQLAPRGVAVQVVGDATAYLGVAATPAHAYACLVTQDPSGSVVVRIDGLEAGCAVAGSGAGINAGDGATAAKYSRYAFHDLLRLTNKGTQSIRVWVNATTDANGAGALVEAARKTTAGAMTDADYSANAAAPITIAVGSHAYVGVRVKSGTLVAGNSVDGALVLETRRA